MNYAARLARLEKLAGKGECPCCRLVKRHRWIDQTKPRASPTDPSLLATSRCEMCGEPSARDLSGYTEDWREVVRLDYTSTSEDRFRDPRAWAAQQWVIHSWAAWDQGRNALR